VGGVRKEPALLKHFRRKIDRSAKSSSLLDFCVQGNGFQTVVNLYMILRVSLFLLQTVRYALCGFRCSIFLFLLLLETLQKIFISFFVGLQDSQNYGNSSESILKRLFSPPPPTQTFHLGRGVVGVGWGIFLYYMI
jgi:hypothetical protein